MSIPCSCCKVAHPEERTQTLQWDVVSIDTFAERRIPVGGFPYPGEVVVQGWKFSRATMLTTVVCEDCESNGVSKIELVARRARMGSFVALGVGAIFGALYLAHDLLRLDPEWMAIGAFASAMVALGLFVGPNESTAPKAVQLSLHESSAQHELTQLGTALKREVLQKDQHPPATSGSGALFVVPHQSYPSLAESWTAEWSSTRYFYKTQSFGSSPSSYDPNMMAQILANRGFATVEEILSSDAG